MTRARATWIGFLAVLSWSFLALLTVATTPVPPLQIAATSFGIGGAVGLFWAWKSGELGRLHAVPWKVHAFGTAGLFGYHLAYFSALRNAPAAQAGLIAYLWPLLIVLFSGLLPGERLRPGQIGGAVIAFTGAALIIAGDSTFTGAHALGYALAGACALIWSGYSVLSRRLGHVPTSSVAVFCLFSAALSLVAHLLLETTVWPATGTGWAALVLLGLGPVGLAFYLWDIGMKKGDIQLLGVASYAAPLLSTLILVLAGIATAGWPLLIAAMLVSGGALVAAKSGRQA